MTKNVQIDAINEITSANLSVQIRNELLSLGKEKARIVGELISKAYTFLESDAELAVNEAKQAVSKASRLASVRELLGIAAYKAGIYETAIRELKTAHRLNGSNEYLPLIADSYRGIGQPKRVFEIACLPAVSSLDLASRAELAIVLAGAYADLGRFDDAQRTLSHELKSSELSTETRLRLTEAKGTFFELAGFDDEATKIWRITEPIRAKLDYSFEDSLIVYDTLEKEA